MTATQPPLFPLGWEVEPCPDVDPVLPPVERRRSPWRIHNGPLSGHGRSAARPDVATGRRIRTVPITIDHYPEGAAT